MWDLVECGLQLEAVAEEVCAREDVESEARARGGHDETAQVAHVAHRARAHQRHQRHVVLLPLVLVHCRHLYDGKSVNTKEWAK